MSNLTGKVALVTGASRGIGKAIALSLADAGASVAITYRNSAAEAQAIVEEICKKGLNAEAYQSDAASFTQSKEIVDKVIERFKRLDILVNNAGITKDTLLMRMTEEDWDSVIDTNLKS